MVLVPNSNVDPEFTVSHGHTPRQYTKQFHVDKIYQVEDPSHQAVRGKSHRSSRERLRHTLAINPTPDIAAPSLQGTQTGSFSPRSKVLPVQVPQLLRPASAR